ncbi:MAG: glutathione-regulated potassium-efflux system ancillary protein KefC, partial [Candidatus Azotimanducaceae bacterium]
NAHRIYQNFRPMLLGLERYKRLDKELPANLSDAKFVVLGMGRVGRGAYDYFAERYPNQVVGVEENIPKMLGHQNSGVNCVHADASDRDFWEHSGMQSREIVLLSLSNHAENITTVKLARDCGFTNKLAVVSRYPDEQKELESLGCIVFNLYAEAGYGFAEHVNKHITS